jgi:hypothetical protein
MVIRLVKTVRKVKIRELKIIFPLLYMWKFPTRLRVPEISPNIFNIRFNRE